MPESSIQRLIEQEGLPPGFGAVVDDCYRPIAEFLIRCRQRHNRPLIAGITGPQGSGKSTMVLFLKALIEELSGLSVAIVSLDDLYLTREQRNALSLQVHPLLKTRGVPGTHAVEMGQELLQRLTQATPQAITPIPRFDKALDTRKDPSKWEPFTGPAQLVLFEGWCLGARPQPQAQLQTPVNDLERFEDPDGRWRHYVNDQLAGRYRALFSLIDTLLFLRAPDFTCIRNWRRLQEWKLRARHGNDAIGMSDDAVDRFVMHFERITRHMLSEMPARADVVIDLDARHRIAGLSLKA